MIITNQSKSCPEQPEPGESYMSFGGMNIDDFILPEVVARQDGLGGPSGNHFQQHSVSSTPGTTTPHYNSSPAPSGTSTPVMNVGTHFSPPNLSGNSPRSIHSPMVVGLPGSSSPGGNGPQTSRPASTNSGLGVLPMSPYGQATSSPQNHQTSPMVAPHMTPPSASAIRPTLISTPPTTPAISTAASKLTSPAAVQSQSMGMIAKVNEALVLTKRSPVIPPTSRLPHLPPMGNPRMMHSTKHPSVVHQRGVQQLHQVGHPRMTFTRSPSYRIYELNRRLQDRSAQGDSSWWDYFVCEFFEDNATISLTLCMDDGPKKFELSRTLIPRFFRSFYEGGAVELFFNLRQTKEWYQNSCFIIDSEACAMETLYVSPIYTKVISEGRLVLEFVPNEMMRIKTWHFAVRGWQEQIPRSALSFQAQQQNPALLQQWTVNITRHGFPGATLSYLKMCCILQPMQHLMTMHKTSGMEPRECLQKTLVHKWQPSPEDRPITVTAQEPSDRPIPKQRKKRKAPVEKPRSAASRKKRSPEPMNLLPLMNDADVMLVGEPSLMGGALGKDDERHITRIENMQLAAAAAAAVAAQQRAGTAGHNRSEVPWTLNDVLGTNLPDFGGSIEE